MVSFPGIHSVVQKLTGSSQSLRVVPAAGHASTVSSVANSKGAPSVRSVPDALRNRGPYSVSADVNSNHPLEARLKQWDETQYNLKMEQLRRLYGAAEPIKRGMEVKMCAVCSHEQLAKKAPLDLTRLDED